MVDKQIDRRLSLFFTPQNIFKSYLLRYDQHIKSCTHLKLDGFGIKTAFDITQTGALFQVSDIGCCDQQPQ